MRIKEIIRPNSIEEAYKKLNSLENTVVLGGTCFLKLADKSYNYGIDLSNLNLDFIIEKDRAIEIGAMTTLRDVERSSMLSENFNGILNESIKIIMGVQFRNIATLGGSICGKYGFSDILTALLSLNTTLLFFNRGEVKLEEFLKEKKANKDILLKVIIEKESIKASFKCIRNTATDFSILNAAVSKDSKGNYKIVVGSRGYVATLAKDAMEYVNSSNNIQVDKLSTLVKENLDFTSDIRASKEYRKEISGVLVKRAFMEVM